jgi:PKD domain
MRPAPILLALAAVVAACQISTKPLPFQLTMQVNRTSATTADTIGVLLDATGGRLINMTVDFGDGETDAFPTGGARSAQALFPHKYTAPGDFKIKATVTDGNEGDKSDSVVVHIQ